MSPEKQTLSISVITSPDDTLLAKLYEGLERNFKDTNELESLENLKRHLAKPNYAMVAITDPATNGVVAASVIAVFPTKHDVYTKDGKQIDGTLQGEYTYVDSAFRRDTFTCTDTNTQEKTERLLPLLMEKRQEVAETLLESKLKLNEKLTIVSISEQENPFKLTPAQYSESLNPPVATDPIKRRESLGFDTLNVPYVQPALGEGKDPVDYVDLCTRNVAPDSLRPLINDHLTQLTDAFYPEGTQLSSQMRVALRNPVTVIPPDAFKTVAANLLNEAGQEVPIEPKDQLKAVQTLMKELAQDETKKHTPIGKSYPASQKAFYAQARATSVQSQISQRL